MHKIYSGFSSFADERNNASDKYIEINNCGFITTNNEKKLKKIQQREFRKDYMIVYFISGGGFFEKEEKLYTIKEGDIVFIKPGVPLNFSYNHKAQHYWIHFDGTALDYILPICGLNETGVYTIGKSQNIIKAFSKLIFALGDNDLVAQIRCSSIFLEMMCNIAETTNGNIKVQSSSGAMKITPALEHMKYLYYEKHPMEFYAKLCDLSLATFQQTFTKIIKCSPSAYLASARLEKACYFLLESNMSIAEIAEMIGYNNQFYFSRFFKKYYGVSPSDYRKKTK